jgi:DNA repair photolyase
MEISSTTISSILTRTSGFLQTVSSHSLQPYRGCALGNSLCGVGCYVRHSIYVTRGQAWGSFVEARPNAAEAYAKQYARERAWARASRGRFGIFLSSSTEPFQPLERTAQVTRRVLEAMLDRPPDFLILQSHSHHVADYLPLYQELAQRCELRIHVSIESDRDELPGLPRAASPVAKRMEAAGSLRRAGLRVVVTVSPLLPIDDPPAFFGRLAEVCDGVVIDHFIGGDGSANGTRTLRTALPVAMAAVDRSSVDLAYRDQIIAVAQRFFPGRTGVNIDGFAGRMLPVAEESVTRGSGTATGCYATAAASRTRTTPGA